MSRSRRILTAPRTIALVSTGVALIALVRSSKRPAPPATIQPTPPITAPPTSAGKPGPVGAWWAVFVTVLLAAVAALLIVRAVPPDTAGGVKTGTLLLLLGVGSLLALIATIMMAGAHNRDTAHDVSLDYAGKLVAVGAAALVLWGSALSAPLLDGLWVGYPPVVLIAFGLILFGLLLYRRARQRP